MINPRPEEELHKAIELGYLIVNSSQPASDELVLAATRELRLASAASDGSSKSWASHVPGWGPNCELLFERGFDVSHHLINWWFLELIE